MISNRKMKQTASDRVFDAVNITLIVMLTFIFFYPLYIVLISSFSSAQAVNAGAVKIWPVNFSVQGFRYIFQYKDIWMGYRNTIFYTVFGTALSVTMTLMAGYSLSRKDLKGRGIIMFYFVFTMYFGGGLIPTFLTVQRIGLVDKPYTLIFLGALGVSNLIITRSFFMMTIPNELFEAASLDGCGDFRYFIRVALPLSGALISVLVLYYGLGNWNGFFSALIYVRNRQYFPLQIFLRNILVMNQNISVDTGASPEEMAQRLQYAETIRYGLIVVASFPVLAVYPYLQKYFVKGIMIGSLKG